MNSKLKGFILVVVNLAALLAIAILWMHAVGTRRIARPASLEISVRAEGSGSLLKEADVETCVKAFYRKDFRKIPVYALRPQALEAKIEQLPLVQKAEVYIDPENRLRIWVTQRNPVVRVVDIRGNHFYLDATGFKIPISSQYSSRVPVATGAWMPVRGNRLDNRELSYYRHLLSLVDAIAADSFARCLVEQIDLDEHGEFTLVPKIGNEKILFGSTENMQDKLSRLRLFYRENMGRKGWNVYQTINLKFEGQVIGRREHFES
ncbi:MAG: hypothetical protein IT266_06145 [Saprospiraceae bacterium]|nr:hypothetical protein [Saprospiraceae bacterium]